jgi:hypothetical protein
MNVAARVICAGSYSFCRCRVESERGRIHSVKYCKTALAILAAVSASLALADDFKTIKGKEYKNVKVSRVEPDGIVLITKSGISKVYFTELPKEVQERFNYDPEKAAQFEEPSNASKANGPTEKAGTPKKSNERVELKYHPPEQLTAAAHKAAQGKMFSPEEEKKALAEVPAGGHDRSESLLNSQRHRRSKMAYVCDHKLFGQSVGSQERQSRRAN